jgi:predicted transglutaminase-like cysteine proteinase
MINNFPEDRCPARRRACIWRTVYEELGGDHALLGACVDSTSIKCGPSRTLWEIIAESRNQEGLALIGHLNRTINLSITPFEPSEWLTALDAINAEGDCKAYATAKYFALREVGFAADRHVMVMSPPRIGIVTMSSICWIALPIGASFWSDRCGRIWL